MPEPAPAAQFADDVLAMLKAQLAGAPMLYQDILPEAEELAVQMAAAGMSASLGDPTSKDLIRVMEARAAVLASTIAGRGQDRAAAVLDGAVQLFAKFLGALVKAVVL